ncbi:hypothetical protein BpHYR1_017460 [Brachionus plicatilis]|uniref:Uncharacterized protein n=1 Tax=Brachionus plicatilis TaxID=10195 RepID=A0A3M7SMV1_BRAPC|nr:hypothetical protein BpHYR1_017460 [Brachionus plicatilis]
MIFSLNKASYIPQRDNPLSLLAPQEGFLKQEATRQLQLSLAPAQKAGCVMFYNSLWNRGGEGSPTAPSTYYHQLLCNQVERIFAQFDDCQIQAKGLTAHSSQLTSLYLGKK